MCFDASVYTPALGSGTNVGRGGCEVRNFERLFGILVDRSVIALSLYRFLVGGFDPSVEILPLTMLSQGKGGVALGHNQEAVGSGQEHGS